MATIDTLLGRSIGAFSLIFSRSLSAFSSILGNSPAPAAPSSFTLTTIDADSVSAAWTLNSGATETGVQLIIATNSGFSTGVQTFNLAADDVIETITGLDPLTTYYSKVRAVRNGAYSTYSNTDDATTTASVIEDLFARTSADVTGDTPDTQNNGQVYGGIFNFFGTTTLTPLQSVGGIAYNTKYTTVPENSSNKIDFLNVTQRVDAFGTMANHTGDTFRIMGIGVRLSGNNNGFILNVTRNAAYLYDNLAGVFVLLDSDVSVGQFNNKDIEAVVIANGTTITADVYTNGHVLTAALSEAGVSNHAANTEAGLGIRCETGGGGTGLGDTYWTSFKVSAP